MIIRIHHIYFLSILIGQFFAIHTPVFSQKQKKKNKSEISTAFYDENQVRFSQVFGNGLTQKLIGNGEAAILQFEDAIKINPSSGAANYEIALIRSNQKKYETALPYIEKAIKFEANNKWYYELYTIILAELKKYKECEKAYHDLIELDPENYNYSLELADLYMAEKKYKEAIQLYDNIEKKMGIQPEISIQKEKLYEAMGQIQKAVDEIKKLIRSTPENADLYGILAELYYRNNKKDEALKTYLKVLELDPLNPVIQLSLANLYQDMGKDSISYDYAKKAFYNPEVSIDDKIKVLLSYYDLIDNQSVYKKQAFELIDILISTHPNEAKSFSIKGDFMLKEKRKDEAIDAFEKVISLDNSRLPVWKELLGLYYEKKDWNNLEIKAIAASEIFPEQPIVYLFLSIVQYNKKEFYKSIETILAGKELVLDEKNLTSEFYQLLAKNYFELKKDGEMIEAFENAIKTDPSSNAIKNNYAYYLALRNLNLSKAESLINEVIQKVPYNSYYLDTYGFILFKKGDYGNAKIIFLKAILYTEKKPGILYEHLGDAYYKTNDIENALDSWLKAKEAGGELSDKIDEKIKLKKWVE
jgi:predicted Zn-dependent protease